MFKRFAKGVCGPFCVWVFLNSPPLGRVGRVVFVGKTLS